MVSGLLYLCIAAVVMVGLVIFYLWRTADTLGEDITLFRAGWLDFDAICVHTYCPKGDVENLPLRGRLTIHQAYLLAYRSQKPILLAVGHTVPGEQRTEAEIYASFLERNYGFKDVILGTDPEARDTAREADEMFRLCKNNGFATVVRFGARPHLARISWHWNRANWFRPKNSETVKTYFVGVYVPAMLYFFEVSFFLVDMGLQFADLYLPQRLSKGLRDLLLNVINRKG